MLVEIPSVLRDPRASTRYDKLALVYRAPAVLHAVIAWAKYFSDTL